MFRLGTIFLFLALIIATPSALAAPSVDDYGALPATSMMTLSPDGKKLAFRKFQEGKDTLVVYSLEHNRILKVLDVAKVNPQHLYFVSDKQLIIRVGQQKNFLGFVGDSRYVSAAYVLDIEKGSLEQLLRPGDKIYVGQTNIGGIVGLSPDRKHAFMPAYLDPNYKPSVAQSVSAGPFYYGLMRVDLSSPSSPGKVYEGVQHSIDYFMGPEGKILVQERYADHANRHQIMVKNGSKWHTIYNQIVEIREIAPVGLTADFKSLVITSYVENSDRLQYLTMSLADGKITDPGFGRADADIEAVITDINRIVYGVQYSGFVPSYKLFDATQDQFVQEVVKKFPENSVTLDSWSEDWSKLLVEVAGSSHPREYYLFDKNLELRFLGTAYANIKPEDVHPIAKVTFAARDGMPIPMLLTIPNQHVSAMKNLPAVMLPHGGPRSYDRIDFDWLAQSLANEGYMVMQPQFRGSAGFGYGHYEAGLGEWGGKMQDDITDALDFMVRKGYVNKDKVCIAGASYGGYAALAGGALTPEKYQCIVSINGIGNLIDFVREEKSMHGRDSWVLSYWNKFITKEGFDQEKLKAVSPYYLTENFTAPVLLIHGVHDQSVNFDQSKTMAERLKKAKKQVQFIKLDDENHHLITNAARLQTVRSVVEFINKELR